VKELRAEARAHCGQAWIDRRLHRPLGGALEGRSIHGCWPFPCGAALRARTIYMARDSRWLRSW